MSWSRSFEVGRGSSPHVAVSADGKRATAVWEAEVDGRRLVQSASADIAGTRAVWGETTTISDADGYVGNFPHVSMSADGTRATAVWSDWRDNEQFVIQSASADIAGTTATWSAPVDVSSPGSGTTPAQVRVSRDGTRATAVWAWSAGQKHVIQAASATFVGDVAAWGPAVTISRRGDAQDPQLGLSANGARATAVWEQTSAGKDSIVSASATIAGATAVWLAPARVSRPSGDTDVPRVEVSESGSRATVVWERTQGGRTAVQSASGAIGRAGATWGAPVDVTIGAGRTMHPQLGLSGDGRRATAVWRRSHGTGQIVQSRSARVTRMTARWGATSDLSAPGGRGLVPQVRVSASGNRATAVWEWMTQGNVVQSRSAGIDGTSADWGRTTDLSTPGRQAYEPQLGLSTDGARATVVWWDLADVIYSASGRTHRR